MLTTGKSSTSCTSMLMQLAVNDRKPRQQECMRARVQTSIKPLRFAYGLAYRRTGVQYNRPFSANSEHNPIGELPQLKKSVWQI